MIDWLADEACGWEIVKIIFSAIICGMIVADVVIPTIAQLIGHTLLPQDLVMTATAVSERSVPIFSLKAFVITTCAEFTEEFAFRFAPLALTFLKFGRSRMVLVAALLSSIVFGYLHGGYDLIFTAGFDGLMFCFVFLKCGGMSGSLIKGLLCSFLAHFSKNAISFALIILVEGKNYMNF